MIPGHIELRGVRVHNLREVDLDIPHRRLIAICGVSGSGKTSLALDTLYAEGQRRYIESFSAYTRQFLERLEKPDADRIEGLPPAVAVTHDDISRAGRTTVGTATEAVEYLRLLFAKVGHTICRGCGQVVRQESSQSAAQFLAQLPAGTRYLVAFPRRIEEGESVSELLREAREEGFVRAILEDRLVQLGDETANPLPAADAPAADAPAAVVLVVDRLTAGEVQATRLTDSLETAFQQGQGRCLIYFPGETPTAALEKARPLTLDGQPWRRIAFSASLYCDLCELEYPQPEPRLLSYNSPLGACPRCEGSGEVIDWDLDLIVPDRRKSLQDGALAPWAGSTYARDREAFLAAAGALHIPVEIPFQELAPEQLALVLEGDEPAKLTGIHSFLRKLEGKKERAQLRTFLNRWRSPQQCPACEGARLRPEARALQLAGRDIAEVSRMRLDAAIEFLRAIPFTPWESSVASAILTQILGRLSYLCEVGLSHLTLDRNIRTLSSGEAHRVSLASVLGSNLVHMLYVLDEPSAGLHPQDVERLTPLLARIRDRGNTVVLVEHDETLLRAADQVVEIGPAAGERGGRVVFQGTPEEMLRTEGSLTGDFITGRRGMSTFGQRRPTRHGWIRLTGARGNNLQNVEVAFPLGVLCVVTGVSGAGKTSLVQDTLYGALCRRLRKESAKPLPYDDVIGDGAINDVILIDQSPVGRTPRSNPVTYIKAFDEIRAVFAETLDARTHNYTAGHFSFNVDGGRCTACEGDGHIRIDMQFLPDVYMKCAQCGGKRYRREILAVLYRGRNIADVLEMTVREAFSFFRGQMKVQSRLKQLIDVGLDYVRLGQPANTLSAGESQRLKLASHLSSAGKSRTLFIMDEPTTGLHFADVLTLIDCFDALLSVGHSLLVVEHNLQLIKAADYVIDLGPGPGAEGGQLVATGSPEELAAHPSSATGRYLARVLPPPQA